MPVAVWPAKRIPWRGIVFVRMQAQVPVAVAEDLEALAALGADLQLHNVAAALLVKDHGLSILPVVPRADNDGVDHLAARARARGLHRRRLLGRGPPGQHVRPPRLLARFLLHVLCRLVLVPAALAAKAGIDPADAATRMIEGGLGVVLASRCGCAKGSTLLLFEGLHVFDSDERLLCGAAATRADKLRKGVAVLKVVWVLLPRDGAVSALLGHNHIPLFSLEHNVGAARHFVSSVLVALNILGNLGHLLVLLHTLAGPGGIRGALDGKDRTDDLAAVPLLRGPHFQAAELVDAEAKAVLGAPVENGRGLLECVLKHSRLGLVVRAGLQLAALRQRREARLARDLEGVQPRGGEQWTGVVRHELAAQEVLLALTADLALLLHQAAQPLDVLKAGVRRSKLLTLLAAIREAWVEDFPEESLVVDTEDGAGVVLKLRPEGLRHNRILAPAAGSHQ
mmetsp:Transcript_80881/g.237744  ORF Transcript_80881/g.237744 Transcript_80881/m.237744 type:complete len:453 (-) Transcript_80881:2528-3886(-)